MWSTLRNTNAAQLRMTPTQDNGGGPAYSAKVLTTWEPISSLPAAFLTLGSQNSTLPSSEPKASKLCTGLILHTFKREEPEEVTKTRREKKKVGECVKVRKREMDSR